MVEPARALLIDLDGVIRRWEWLPQGPIEEQFGLPAGTVAGVAFEPALLEEAVLGRITDEEWRQRVAARLAETYGRETATAAVAAWSAPAGVVDWAVLDLVRKARRRARVCLVTNASTRLEVDLQRLGIPEEFDAIVNSSRVGARKPGARIFEAALAAADVPAAQALYVDDKPGFVAAAQGLGLRGHVFTGVQSLSDALRAAGLHDGGCHAARRARSQTTQGCV
jgi:putative hydrolase of the HAD superfamily